MISGEPVRFLAKRSPTTPGQGGRSTLTITRRGSLDCSVWRLKTWACLSRGNVVSTVDGTIQSVAVWMDSAVAVPSSVFHAMEAAVAELEGSHHEASLACSESLRVGGRSGATSFWLYSGLAAARQRQGLAGWALAPGLAAADREGAGSFLETSSVSNLAFYSTFGFEVIGHMCIGGGGPDVWAMFRKPRPAAGRTPSA